MFATLVHTLDFLLKQDIPEGQRLSSQNIIWNTTVPYPQDLKELLNDTALVEDTLGGFEAMTFMDAVVRWHRDDVAALPAISEEVFNAGFKNGGLFSINHRIDGQIHLPGLQYQKKPLILRSKPL